MAQTGDAGSNRPGRRIILVIGLALSTAIVVVTGVLAYVTLNHTGNQTNQTNQAGTSKCTAASPYGFTTINANTQLVSVYKQLDVCWVRYQYHWGVHGKKPGIETDTGCTIGAPSMPRLLQ